MYVTVILNLTVHAIVFDSLYHLFYIGLLYLQWKKIKMLNLMEISNK